MPSESRTLCEDRGSLGACLVDEQTSGARRLRRRALIISILSQSAILIALLLLPLFGKPERIAAKEFVPVPPYSPARHTQRGEHRPTDAIPRRADYFNFSLPTGRPRWSARVTTDPPEGVPGLESTMDTSEAPSSCSWCVPGERNSGPRPPQTPPEAHQRRLVFTHLDPAMLIHRVEPIYPPLAIQIHKEGKVELRAIIATDGSIQSLQIVAGDQIFYLSAREAVQQWRYKPTVLDGQPVEIATYITVIYAMTH